MSNVAPSLDTYGVHSLLDAPHGDVEFYDIQAVAREVGSDPSRLPFSIRIMLEIWSDMKTENR